VTICVRNRECLFGEIDNGEMRLNRAGNVVKNRWDDLPKHFGHIEFDSFVVMPNHVHGIIMILPNDSVGAIHESPLRADKMLYRRRMLLPRIIGRFKMNSAKQINDLRGTHGIPVWQRNYYEHVIRDEKSQNKIREYVETNPLRWQMDKENPHIIEADGFGRGMNSL
jgi:putative transposase